MVKKTGKTFEITCRGLTRERKKTLALLEVASIGKSLRIVIAIGGAWLFYYGTDFDVPDATQGAAIAFAAIGIAAILFAIFIQNFKEVRFFAKARKTGCLPENVSVGKGGIFVRRAGSSSASAERFYSYAEIGKIKEYEEHFKINLLYGEAPCLFLFKEDFEHGEPEAFVSFILSKQSAL